jgi:membrane-bound ClpP family serine protease
VILLAGIAIAVFVVPDAWTVPVIVAAVAVEVTETAFTMWWSRRAPPKVGPETLAGSLGRAIEDCRPVGRVRVRGEIWQARSEIAIPAGTRIRVLGRDQLVLLVEPAD